MTTHLYSPMPSCTAALLASSPHAPCEDLGGLGRRALRVEDAGWNFAVRLVAAGPGEDLAGLPAHEPVGAVCHPREGRSALVGLSLCCCLSTIQSSGEAGTHSKSIPTDSLPSFSATASVFIIALLPPYAFPFLAGFIALVDLCGGLIVRCGFDCTDAGGVGYGRGCWRIGCGAACVGRGRTTPSGEGWSWGWGWYGTTPAGFCTGRGGDWIGAGLLAGDGAGVFERNCLKKPIAGLVGRATW